MNLRLQIATSLLCIIPFFGFAQQVPNGDLEAWIAVSGAPSGAEYPEGWETPDILGAVFGVSDAVTAKSTDSYSGGFSAELTTKLITIPFVGDLTIPGTLALGTIVFDPGTLAAGVVGGYAMTESPTSLMGYYKYTPAAGDSMNVAIIAKTGGVQTGGGQLKDPATVTAWTMFDVPIVYGAIPDTIQIIITSSGGFTSATAGSVLMIDGLAFTGIVSAENLAGTGIKPNVYPNPAVNFINIDNPLKTSATIEVFNLNGVKADEIVLTPGLNALDLSDYPSGVYSFRVTDNGKYVYSNKFTVSK